METPKLWSRARTLLCSIEKEMSAPFPQSSQWIRVCRSHLQYQWWYGASRTGCAVLGFFTVRLRFGFLLSPRFLTSGLHSFWLWTFYCSNLFSQSPHFCGLCLFWEKKFCAIVLVRFGVYVFSSCFLSPQLGVFSSSLRLQLRLQDLARNCCSVKCVDLNLHYLYFQYCGQVS